MLESLASKLTAEGLSKKLTGLSAKEAPPCSFGDQRGEQSDNLRLSFFSVTLVLLLRCSFKSPIDVSN